MKVTFEGNSAIIEMNRDEFIIKHTQCDVCGEWFPNEEVETLWDGKQYKSICKKHIPENARKCDQCGEYYLEDAILNLDGKWYCEDCAEDNNYHKCTCCGEWVHEAKSVYCEDDEEWYCEDCAEEDGIYACYECGHYHHREDMSYADDLNDYFCQECARNCLSRCDGCGCYVYYDDSLTYCEDDDCYYCDSCCHKHNGPIDTYHTFQEEGCYNFNCTMEQLRDCEEVQRRDNLHLGFELEIDDGREQRGCVASDLSEILNTFCRFENDSSLNSGFEIISHPATLDWLIENKEMINKAMNRCIAGGYKSHNANTCGLHVHVDKKFFGEKLYTSAAKIVYIFEKFWDNLVIFSRRSSDAVNDWAKRYNEPISHVLSNYMNSPYHHNRYYAVNLTNENTIEFRIAKGTLKLSTFFATIKFYDRICHIAKEKTATEIAKMSWEDILGDDEEINAYWKERLDRQ